MLYIRASQCLSVSYPAVPLPLYFFFAAGFAAGGGAAGAAFGAAFGASVCFAAPPMMSSRLSPFLPCFVSATLAMYAPPSVEGSTYLLPFTIPPCAELGSEGGQFARLVLLDVQQLLTAGVPQRVVPDVLGALEDGLRAGRAQREGGAVGQGDELCECVGPLGAAQEGRVAHLLRLAGVGRDGGAEGAEGAGGGDWRRHCEEVEVEGCGVGGVNAEFGSVSVTFSLARGGGSGGASEHRHSSDNSAPVVCVDARDCRECLGEIRIEWRSRSVRRRASLRPSTDGAVIQVGLACLDITTITKTRQNSQACAPCPRNTLAIPLCGSRLLSPHGPTMQPVAYMRKTSLYTAACKKLAQVQAIQASLTLRNCRTTSAA